jgi:uncharacterized protein with FMN-binding domain
MLKWIIVLVVASCLVIGGAIAWPYVSREHVEAMSLPLNRVDFSKLKDGTYRGTYEGGMYKWRESEVRVTVSSGKVTTIELVKNKEKQPPQFTDKLFNRVREAQSLHVDAISGATLTSKAYLQAVENALVGAQ